MAGPKKPQHYSLESRSRSERLPQNVLTTAAALRPFDTNLRILVTGFTMAASVSITRNTEHVVFLG